MKTALVPAFSVQAWRHPWNYSPFGGDSVQLSWPYLGSIVGAWHIRLPPLGSPWASGLLVGLANATWKKAIRPLHPRSDALALCDQPQGRRAAGWNSYLDSLLAYPSHIVPPRVMACCRMVGAFQKGLRCTSPWVKPWILAVLGPLVGVPGAPKWPLASVDATLARTSASGDL